MVTGIFLFTFALSSLTVRFRPMQKLRFISANIFLSVICSVLLSACQDTYDLDDKLTHHYSMDFDASCQGEN